MAVAVINVVIPEVLTRASVRLDINLTQQDETVTEVSWCVSGKNAF